MGSLDKYKSGVNTSHGWARCALGPYNLRFERYKYLSDPTTPVRSRKGLVSYGVVVSRMGAAHYRRFRGIVSGGGRGGGNAISHGGGRREARVERDGLQASPTPWPGAP